MTDLNRLQLRQSEVREKINAFIAKDALEDAERSELDSLTNEMQSLEPRLRAALTLQEAENEKANDPKLKEVKRRASLTDYWNSIVNKRNLEGAAAEWNKELKLSGSQIPWECFVEPEERAATQVSDYNGGLVARPVLQRLFAADVFNSLGVRLDSVGAGEQEYVLLLSGPNPMMQLEGGVTSAAVASTFQTQILKPKRISAQIEFSRELLASVAGIESALRMDMLSAMRDKMNNQILIGNGAPNVTGIFSRLTKPSVPSAVADYEDFAKCPSLGVDGIHAYRSSQIGICLNPEVYQFGSSLFQSGSGESAIMALERVARSVTVSTHVPKAPTSSTRANVAEVVLSAGTMGSHVAAVWEGVNLIVDEISLADKGQVRVTAWSLWDAYTCFRADATKLVSFKMQ